MGAKLLARREILLESGADRLISWRNGAMDRAAQAPVACGAFGRLSGHGRTGQRQPGCAGDDIPAGQKTRSHILSPQFCSSHFRTH
ncbi:hypothetical protein WG908_15010 [Sphingobium sp. AN641]|uniref:hypothetical protein n=1 Tax=Sphingobium sp. AN641 TaxID=3133443 RepID=UPI0030C10084